MALPPMVRHMVMRNKTLLAEVLKYHVVSGIVKSTSLKNEMLAASLAGPKIRVNIYKDGKVCGLKVLMYFHECPWFQGKIILDLIALPLFYHFSPLT